MKVFLCHSSQDKPLVREVARALPSGVSVWLDEREIHTGQGLLSAISDGIKTSGFIIAFLTDASLTSDWVQRELRIALTKEEQSRRVCILPVLVQPVRTKLPEFLSDRSYLTITSMSARELKAAGEKIAEEVCYWVCRSDTFCRLLRTQDSVLAVSGEIVKRSCHDRGFGHPQDPCSVSGCS